MLIADKTSIQNQYMRVPQAAAYTGLSISTLNKKRLYGGGPAFSRVGGSRGAIIYAREDLDAWIAARRVGSTAEADALAAQNAAA